MKVYKKRQRVIFKIFAILTFPLIISIFGIAYFVANLFGNWDLAMYMFLLASILLIFSIISIIEAFTDSYKEKELISGKKL